MGIHVVLVHPEIHWNTGNAGRTCLAAGATLHLRGSGRNDHHLAEAAFKSLGRALRVACEIDPRRSGVASTKGVLE